MNIFKLIITISTVVVITVSLFFYMKIREKELELFGNVTDKIIEEISFLKVKNNDNPENICNDRDIFIYKDIDAKLARNVILNFKLLESRNASKDINLYINSSSGNFADTFAIIGVMKSLKCKINTIATGNCLGPGAFILASGTGERSATENTIIGVYLQIKKDLNGYDDLDKLKINRIANFWEKKAKFPESWLDNSAKEVYYYLTPEQAKGYGIIQKILN